MFKNTYIAHLISMW